MYRVIVADPPWSFEDKLEMNDVDRGAASQYDVMTVEEICRLPIQPLIADDAVLALWFVAAQPQAGLNVMAAWGFRQTQIWTWKKRTKTGKQAFGLGRLGRNSTEHLFVGVKGRIYKHLASRSERTEFSAPARAHSEKPEELQDKLDRMFPRGHRLEMFARRDRPDWDCVGLECPSTAGVDIRKWLCWKRTAIPRVDTRR